MTKDTAPLLNTKRIVLLAVLLAGTGLTAWFARPTQEGEPRAALGSTPREGAPGPGVDRLKELKAPTPAVRVRQRENGSLEITNTDPKLTGTQMTVTGLDAAGKKRNFTVRVPAPPIGQ